MNSVMHYVKGDILSPADGERVIICHQVNCLGVMGAGLAKQIRKKYPVVYDMYKKVCNDADNPAHLLGGAQAVAVEEGVSVVNLFGQVTFGRTGECHTNYHALRFALASVAKMADGKKIRIPYKLGCGLAGGDWNVVSEIIEEELSGTEYEIWELKR